LQSVVELVTGRDYIAGKPTSRALAAVGIIAGLLPMGKGLLKGGTKIIGAIGRSADDAVDVARVAGRVDDAVPAVNNAAKPLPTATQPNRIYSARELIRRADEPGPFHNFPDSFNKEIFENGTRTVTPNFFNKARPGMSNDSIQFRLPGTVNGRDGMFEIFTRPSTSGNTEVIMHRFFKPNP